MWIATQAGLDRLDRNANTVTHFGLAKGSPAASRRESRWTVRGACGSARTAAWPAWSPPQERSGASRSPTGCRGASSSSARPSPAPTALSTSAERRGSTLIRPEAIVENLRPPPVALTGFQLFNRPVAIGAEGSPLTQLDHGDRPARALARPVGVHPRVRGARLPRAGEERVLVQARELRPRVEHGRPPAHRDVHEPAAGALHVPAARGEQRRRSGTRKGSRCRSSSRRPSGRRGGSVRWRS